MTRSYLLSTMIASGKAVPVELDRWFGSAWIEPMHALRELGVVEHISIGNRGYYVITEMRKTYRQPDPKITTTHKWGRWRKHDSPAL